MKAITLFPVLLLAACAAIQAPLPSADDVRIGQSIMVGAVRITPEVVLEDSRCPYNARCIWAGQVRLRVGIVTGGQRGTQELILGTPVIVGGKRLMLSAVRPERKTAGAPAPADYHFSFEVQPKS
jgi:hypothetical protein